MFTELSATCEFVTRTDDDTQLVMDLQDEALELVADVVARRLLPSPLAGKWSKPAGGPVAQLAGGSS